MSGHSTSGYQIPGFFVPHIQNYVQECGGDASAVLVASGIKSGSFDPHRDYLSEDQLHQLVAAAREQSGEQAFGFELGTRFSLGSFGLLSRALMSCATLREFGQMLERYSVLVLPLMRFSSYETREHYVVEVNTLSRYPELNQTIFEAILSCWNKLIFPLVGQEVEIDKLSCSFPAPAYQQRFQHSAAREVEFGAQRNLISLKPGYAGLALTTANPIDALATREQCEEELIRSRQNSLLADRVRDQVRYYLDTAPSASELAARLNMTERTFRRKLALENTSYRELVKTVREEMAIYYLEHTRLQVSEIALKLGYQETSNFRAAFKDWKGVSPRQWRQQAS